MFCMMPSGYTPDGFRNPIPATDVIIEYRHAGKEGIILIARKNLPLGLAIPGGFAEWGISFEDNAIKEAKEETNLEVILESPEHPLCVHSDPRRDPRAHIVSITYVARGYGTLQAGDDAAAVYLVSIPELKGILQRPMDIAFRDHAKILDKYLRYRGHAP